MKNKPGKCPACFYIYDQKENFGSKSPNELTDSQSVSGRKVVLSPIINKIIQVSNGEKKNDKSTQPKGSRCLFFAIRYAMCIRKRYTNPNATVLPKIISNTSHTSGSTTTRIVCRIKLVILPCRISIRILPCIYDRDLSELHHSYNRHNDPYTHIHPA